MARSFAAALLLLACTGDPPEQADSDTRGAPDVESDAPFGASDASDSGTADAGEDVGLAEDAVGADDTQVDAAPDAGPDGIAFVRPLAGASASGQFGFEVVVSTPSPTAVTFTANGAAIRVDAEPPYAAIWDVTDVPDGAYTVEAVADFDGGEARATLDVFVDRTGPTIQFLEPSDTVLGATDGRLPFSLDVTDPAGVLQVRVQSLGQVYVLDDAPYVGAITVPTDIRTQLRIDAVAYDRLGNVSREAFLFDACPAEQVLCDGVCAPIGEFQINPAHCGGCGLSCDIGREVCDAGSCACAEGLQACGDTCVNVTADTDHCGACGVACSGTDECVAGTCRTDDGSSMVTVLPGTFALGPRPGESGLDRNVEFPLEVTITRPFAVDRTEVTQQEWSTYFDVNPSEFWDCGPDCPVEMVTWYDAIALANARSTAEGLRPCYDLEDCNEAAPGAGFFCDSVPATSRSGSPLDCEGYRLPTEAEWEIAYRAGTVTSTFAGEVVSLACESTGFLSAVAWYSCNSGETPHPVGTRLPNALGLHDMAGNVFEWTWDIWRSESGPVTSEVDPLGGPEGSSRERGFRGGSWNERASRLRASSRLSAFPTVQESFVGFRLVRTVDEDSL